MNQVFASMLDGLDTTPERKRYVLDYLNTLLAQGYYRHVSFFPTLSSDKNSLSGRDSDSDVFPVLLTTHNQNYKVSDEIVPISLRESKTIVDGCAVSINGSIVQRRLVLTGSGFSFV